ncbi:phenylacetate--CoA ligase family protein [Parasporobacterium paucivorans]|uniref:Phenylacetate-coenzyme A ligase n=1 Tax=Parasporobacterium paucivorans DSM 15970 TaxID=1122934 RepID=A0A1M6GLN4_9FIRM|nr:phenylacetate--CoA ligase [Parasporobacterium paucivorans]SHJ10805.1 phenylacetate-CoA ligase [Parasporobacterium paucivorans DSM 15970]
MKLRQDQFEQIKEKIRHLKTLENHLYSKKFAEVDLDKFLTQEDFEALPFTNKDELRECYPLGIAAVPEKDIVRIHSSSGTTGTPVIIPYTKTDVEDWAIMFKRCYEMAGITENDRIHITPGYGLWTAGIGFQNGAELLGSLVIPMGPGNTDKQLQMMMDMKSTVLCATSSYALLLAEEIEKRGIRDKIHLRVGVIGSERWGEKMRKRIANELGVHLYDIYGLTEIYGPGIGMSCEHECGMHYWDDYVYFEIIDPKTGKVLPNGEIGELVITTLRKEGAPLIRYRTHDLTRIIPGECPCGSPFPRIDTLIGRSDDMVKVKGVNIYPGQIEDVLRYIDGVSSEYQVMIDHLNGKDIISLYFETNADASKDSLEAEVRDAFKSKVGITVIPIAVEMGELPRSEKKSTRVFDNRY